MNARTMVAVLALATLLTAPASAGTRSWTLDDTLAVKTLTDPQRSPDGRWVASVVSELNTEGSEYNTDVWLVAVSGGPTTAAADRAAGTAER